MTEQILKKGKRDDVKLNSSTSVKLNKKVNENLEKEKFGL
jgi:hypothetical protein